MRYTIQFPVCPNRSSFQVAIAWLCSPTIAENAALTISSIGFTRQCQNRSKEFTQATCDQRQSKNIKYPLTSKRGIVTETTKMADDETHEIEVHLTSFANITKTGMADEMKKNILSLKVVFLRLTTIFVVTKL